MTLTLYENDKNYCCYVNRITVQSEVSQFQTACYTPKSRGFLKNSSNFDFDALNVALNDARLIDLCTQKLQSTLTTFHKYHTIL